MRPVPPVKGFIMDAINPSIEEIQAMDEAQLKALQKKLSKQILKRVALKAAVTIVTLVAVELIVNALSSNEDEDQTED